MKRARRCYALCLLLLSQLSIFSLPAQQRVDICYFGDSITEGWIESQYQPAMAYPALTDSLLRASGRIISSVHSGRGGETTEDALARIDADVLRHAPRVVVLAFGSNDWFVWGDPPFQRVSLDRYVSNLHLMIKKIRGISAIPVVITPPVVLEPRFHRYFDSLLYVAYGGVEACSGKYAAAAAQAARDGQAWSIESVPYSGREQLLGYDGVHPLAEGHRTLAVSLSKLMEGILDSATLITSPSSIDLYPVPFQRAVHQRLMLTIGAVEGGEVHIGVFDAAGREVRKFVYFAWSAGTHYLHWDGRTANGTPASAGAYTVFVRAGSRYSRQQLLIL
jgi:lysophospholipase L1-like esterase